MDARVIGTVGKIGSGKDELLKYLKSRYGIPFVSTGDVVRRLAAEEGVEPTRENLERISQSYFRKLGKGCFVRMVAENILKKRWKVAGISGVRTPDDVRILKDMFADRFTLVRVVVPDPRLRFRRLKLRHEGRDASTYRAFLEQDRAEETEFSIGRAERMADVEVKNDGTLAALHRRIGALVRGGKLIVR